MRSRDAAAFARNQRRYPSVYDLRRGARTRLPHFAFEYGDGGAGDDVGIVRNWAALDKVTLLPRYGVVQEPPNLSCEIFGETYAAPFGVAPMGSPIIVWPGADKLLATAAQRAKVPYVLGIVAGATIEEITQIAPDVTWLQMYRFARDDHAVGWKLLERAKRANVKALMLTLDVPVRTVRPREAKVGLAGTSAFRPTLGMIAGMMKCPGWALAVARNNIPKFANLQPYAGPNANLNKTIQFAREQMGGAFSWEEVKRYRDRWDKPLVLKGVLHPEDAEIAASIGVDGIVVSNHGGRQIDALPAPINLLPEIVSSVSGRLSVFYDSGVRSGSDVARAVAIGAAAAFAGKAFLWGLGALGSEGPEHTIALLMDELQSTLGQVGALSVQDAKNVSVFRPNSAG
jgi:(S)-mandelate dehydrogenase